MADQLVVRCRNRRTHTREFVKDGVKRTGQGGVLVVLEGDCIYVKCNDGGCRSWNRIKIKQPGVKLDFGNAALTQRIMPKGCSFNMKGASVVVEE